METLGLAEIAMTILEARLDVPSATAAAITRERHGEELHVHVTLLSDPPADAAPLDGTGPDADGPGDPGEVVAAFAVRRLSPDLTDAFGEKDVIILK
jgi:hypothetical protein